MNSPSSIGLENAREKFNAPGLGACEKKQALIRAIIRDVKVLIVRLSGQIAKAVNTPAEHGPVAAPSLAAEAGSGELAAQCEWR